MHPLDGAGRKTHPFPSMPILFTLHYGGLRFSCLVNAGVHVSHMLYADDLSLLTNEPRDMQIMLSRLAVYARNKHLIVNTFKSEVVHFNSAGENVPVFDVGGATLHHKDSFRYLGMVFYRTLNMAKSAEHAARPFLASAYAIGYVDLCVNTLWQTGHTLLCGSLRRMLFLLACMVVNYGVLLFCRQAGSSLARCL